MNTPDADDKFFEMLAKYLNGDESALRFCWILNFICHIWDDMIDKDKERTDADIHHAFMTLILELPANQFYKAHFGVLSPLILSTCLQYQTANKMERSAKMSDKICAYSIRNDMLNIFGMCIYLTGGQQAYDAYAAEYYSFCSENVINEYPVFVEEMK